MSTKSACCLVILALGLAGCATRPPAGLFRLDEKSIRERELKSRLFHGVGAEVLLLACSNHLQDLGFTIDQSEERLGMLSASKQRNALDTGELSRDLLLALLLPGYVPNPSWSQTFQVSVVVYPDIGPGGQPGAHAHRVRANFQRMVERTDHSVYFEPLDDPELYEAFFSQLSKSVFLEANP